MKNIKLILLGIAVMLFGLCSLLLSGLGGLPTYNNAVFELLGVISPIAGVIIAAAGFFIGDNKG